MNKAIFSLTLALFSLLVGCQGPSTPKASPKPAGPLYKGHHLVYYYRTTCPYSIKVTNYLRENKIPVTWRNIQDDKYAKELVKVGGRKRVPCLVVDGQAMYGSNAIMQWLTIQAEKS